MAIVALNLHDFQTIVRLQPPRGAAHYVEEIFLYPGLIDDNVRKF